jgi:TetR/AcrR family transcriptional repressor of nem operon
MPDLSTRDLILGRADALFYEAGFEATSFADIAAAVGISRGNFYHHFKSKDDILTAVIDLRHRRTQATLAAWEEANDTPLAGLCSFVRLFVVNRAKIMAHGCPVGTLCQELAKLDHPGQAEAAAIMALFRDWLTDQLRAAGTGDDAPRLALELLGWSQGTAVLASTFHDADWLDAEIRRIETWLAGLGKTSTH